MWIVDQLERRPVTFDYRDSGLGVLPTYSVHSTATCLINNAARVDFSTDPVQVFLCKCCGSPHCESGGWVSLRRIGPNVIWIPAFDQMLAGDWELSEYAPPKSYRQPHGIPVFNRDAYDELASMVEAMPDFQQIEVLTVTEAARVLQWIAPFAVLGSFPSPPSIDRKAILAVSEGSLPKEMDAVDTFMAQCIADQSKTDPVAGTTIPIEFHLDTPQYTSWIPCSRANNSLAFNLPKLGVFSNLPQ